MRTRCARMEPSGPRAASACRVVPAPPTAPARRLRLLRSLLVSWDGTLDRVDVVLLEDGHPAALDARQLLGNFLVESRLHVENSQGDDRREMVDLATDQRRRHVLAEQSERAGAV